MLILPNPHLHPDSPCSVILSPTDAGSGQRRIKSQEFELLLPTAFESDPLGFQSWNSMPSQKLLISNIIPLAGKSRAAKVCTSLGVALDDAAGESNPVSATVRFATQSRRAPDQIPHLICFDLLILLNIRPKSRNLQVALQRFREYVEAGPEDPPKQNMPILQPPLRDDPKQNMSRNHFAEMSNGPDYP